MEDNTLLSLLALWEVFYVLLQKLTVDRWQEMRREREVGECHATNVGQIWTVGAVVHGGCLNSRPPTKCPIYWHFIGCKICGMKIIENENHHWLQPDPKTWATTESKTALLIQHKQMTMDFGWELVNSNYRINYHVFSFFFLF